MKNEIESAANFLSNMLRLHSGVLTPCQLEQFKQAISLCLESHYQSHWFPDRPTKGSGYRCIRINHKMDPIISQAGQSCGIDSKSLKSIFPNELTLWVDPSEVAYRIGENGSICVLFDGQQDNENEKDQHQQSNQQQNQSAANKQHQQHQRSPFGKQQLHHSSSAGHHRNSGSGRGSPSDTQSISSSTSTMSSPSPSSSPDWVKRPYGNSPDNWKSPDRRSSPESVIGNGTSNGYGMPNSGLEPVAMFPFSHPHQMGGGSGHHHYAFNAGVMNPVSVSAGHRSAVGQPLHPVAVHQQQFTYNWPGSPFRV